MCHNPDEGISIRDKLWMISTHDGSLVGNNESTKKEPALSKGKLKSGKKSALLTVQVDLDKHTMKFL